MKIRAASIKQCRRWIRIGKTGRCHVIRQMDTGQSWFKPARQKRWAPGAEEK